MIKRILPLTAVLAAATATSIPSAAAVTGDGGGSRFTISGGHFVAYGCKYHHRTGAGGYRYECISGVHYTGSTMGWYGGTACVQSLNNRWTWYSNPADASGRAALWTGVHGAARSVQRRQAPAAAPASASLRSW